MLLVVVTAAGRSERFGGGKKELELIEGRSVLDRAVSLFLGLPDLAYLVITGPRDQLGAMLGKLGPATRAALGSRFSIIPGGPSRRDSVRLGLEAAARALSPPESRGKGGLPEKLDNAIVLVHDGARPWASTELAARVASAAAEKGAAVPLVPLSDTPKSISPDGLITAHPKRSTLAAAQTPQGFRFGGLLDAHRRAAAENYECTDDAELWAHYIGPVSWVEGEAMNRKITYRSDLGNPEIRVGQGWDLHRLVSGRRLLLGGVEIPSELGEEAHSDGDVLLHAVIDALLGAASLGDIGTHFPPEDSSWKDADSRSLTKTVLGLVHAAGWSIVNIDCTVTLEAPKLGPLKEAVRRSLASVLGIDADTVSVKAKTSEGVNAAGELRAIEASAVVLLRR